MQTHRSSPQYAHPPIHPHPHSHTHAFIRVITHTDIHSNLRRFLFILSLPSRLLVRDGCSALFHRSLWDAVPGGYPVATLFGYEDWAFWIDAQQRLKGGIRPCTIHEELFHYRIRPQSMHQSLLSYQEYSIASLRMLHPNLYPSELMIAAHDRFLGLSGVGAGVPTKVKQTLEAKAATFPWHPTIQTMRGLLLEGKGRLEEAMAAYQTAAHLADAEDWQGRWRLALVQQRLGMVEEGNRTLSALVNEFEGVGELYRNYLLLSNERGIVRGPLYLQ